MGKNHVFINDAGIIEIVVSGDQTVESIDAIGNEAERLVRQRRKEGKPALVLDDVLLIGSVPAEARQRVVELAKSVNYQKFAMVGKGTTIKMAANLLLQAIGKARKVKYFDDYSQAVEWLKIK